MSAECGISGSHLDGSASGAVTSSKFSAPSLCRISSRSPSRPELVLDAVLHALAARQHHAPRTGRVGRVQQPGLAGDLAAHGDVQVALAAGEPHADPEPLVGFLVHDHVVIRRGADHMPQHPVRPPGVVDGHVEQRRAVQRQAQP